MPEPREPQADLTHGTLVAELRRAISSGGGDVQCGQLAGLTSADPAPLSSGGEMSDAFRAGTIHGAICRRLLTEQGEIDHERFLATGLYAAALAQAGAGGALDHPSADAALREHNAACIRIVWNGKRIAEDDERLLFTWLTDELGIPVVDELLAKFHRSRARRIADPRVTGRRGGLQA